MKKKGLRMAYDAIRRDNGNPIRIREVAKSCSSCRHSYTGNDGYTFCHVVVAPEDEERCVTNEDDGASVTSDQVCDLWEKSNLRKAVESLYGQVED